MQPKSQFHNITSTPLPLPVFQQETLPLPIVPIDNTPITEEKPSPLIPLKPPSKKWIARVAASGITLLLLAALYVIWFAAPSTPTSSSPTGISQQSFGPSGQTSTASTPTSGDLHVYVTGSVKHPGVYSC